MLIKIWKSVDIFTGWVEALPTWSEKAVDICKSCLIELIPWFGPPKSFQSDCRPSFIAKITQRFTEALELDYKLHIFWHPESKTNHILKKTLAKLCQETHEHWTMQSSGSLYPLGMVWDLANLKWPTRGLFLLLTFYCMRTWTRTSSEGSPGLCTRDTVNSH